MLKRYSIEKQYWSNTIPIPGKLFRYSRYLPLQSLYWANKCMFAGNRDVFSSPKLAFSESMFMQQIKHGYIIAGLSWPLIKSFLNQ